MYERIVVYGARIKAVKIVNDGDVRTISNSVSVGDVTTFDGLAIPFLKTPL